MKIFLSIAILILFFNFSKAQGCSDAGICSVGNVFLHELKVFKNNLEVATIFGAGDFGVKFIAPYISYTRNFNDQFSISSKVTFSSANGNFGTNSSIGDIFFIGNYKFKAEKISKWSTTLGLKIPTNNANQKINSLALPMDYQSSLGTYDLFLGLSLNYKKFDFNTVLQIPIINNNKNSYFNNSVGTTTTFPSTNLFERKSDFLFRTTYNLKTSNNKLTFKPNLLFLYHIGNDTFENILGNRQEILGSKGITLNANLITNFSINESSNIELSIATPFVVRQLRPDGLTRRFTAGIGYKLHF